jgi:hypothetical protein
MAVSFLTASESHTGTTGNTSSASFTWSHASSGTPKGVVVFVHQVVTVTSDLCTGVTYGGVSMDPLGTYVSDTTTEPGSTKAYFLGSGVPTGTQNVVVSRTNNTVAMYATCQTFGADGDTTTAGYVTQGGDVSAWTGLDVDDGSPGTNSMRVMGMYSGPATIPAAGTGTTRDQVIDFGNYGCSLYRQTTASQGSFKVACASLSDDCAAIAFAVTEVVSLTFSVTVPVGSLTLTGQVPTVTATDNQSVTVPVGSITFSGLAPSIAINPYYPVEWVVKPSAGSLVATGYAPTWSSAAAGSSFSVTVPAGSLSITGQAPVVTAGDNQLVTVPAGSITITGQVPVWSASDNQTVTVPVGAIAFSGLAPTVTATDNKTVDVPVGALTITGLVPAVTGGQGLTLIPPTGSIVLTGQIPSVSVTDHKVVDVPVGSVVVTGFVPTISAGGSLVVTPDTGSTVLSGLAPTVTASDHRVVEVPVGSVTVTGLVPSVTGAQNVNVQASTRSFTLTEQPAAITLDRNVFANLRTLSLTTFPASISVGSAGKVLKINGLSIYHP